MKQFIHRIQVATRGKGLYPLNREIEGWVEGRGLSTGILTIFIQHTSASLTIQENADPDIVRDIEEFFTRLVPESAPWYRHTSEGPDDMPSHIKSVLTQTQLTIPVVQGKLALGAWQGIYVFEHRAQSHRRSLVLHLAGE